MSVPFDESLVVRLPLPLAQLYSRAHNAKTALDRHQAAYFLWEAALKLLASVAIVEYAGLPSHDAQITECLQNLSRPSLGHWWEFVRRLTPILADAGAAKFPDVREWLLGQSRSDLPRTASLDALLLKSLDDRTGARSTVRLTELFDRLVRYRNREIGHGAPGQRPVEFYNAMGWGLLAGMGELLGRLDMLAGRRLIHVTQVSLQDTGDWLIEAAELRGETARNLPEPLALPAATPRERVPHPSRTYLLMPDGSLVELHPLLLYDPKPREALLLNSRRGQQRTEYLCYTSGRVDLRADLGGEQRALLARVLGMAVEEENAERWAARAQADDGPPPPPSEPAPRQLGEFELLSELGEGAMGKVYRAWQPSLGRQVAVKEMLPTSSPERLDRFAREIQALGRVEHPNLVKIFTSGSQGDKYFYAMELIEGATVADVYDRLHESGPAVTCLEMQTWRDTVHSVYQDAQQTEKRLGGPAPEAPARPPVRAAVTATQLGSPDGRSYIAQVVELVRQTARAAHALHQVGVIHRDIKPGNIMVTGDGGQAVLMDLGLAQLTDPGARRLTRSRQFLGTLRYASPQQVLAAARLDCRTDVYSLGATLWELLTLRPLFGADDQTSEAELMERIQRAEPERVRKYNPAVPRDLQAIVMKCLEKSPDRRYASARELADDLRRFQRGELVKARPVGPIERSYRWLRKRPAAVLATLLALVTLSSGVGGYFLWNLKQQRDQEAAREPEVNYQHDVELAELLGVPAKLVRKPKDKRQYLEEGSPPMGPPQMIELENRRWRTRYSFLGNLIELTCLGLDDAPALTSKGFHRWVARYDDRDNLVEEVHFGTGGELVSRPDGTFRGVYRFNSNNKAIDQRELGPNGRPINNKLGWARRVDVYRSSGEVAESALWKADAKGRLRLWKRIDGEKNPDGEERHFESVNLTDEGEQRLWPERYHRWTGRYNSAGKPIEQVYYGLNGERVKPTWGHHHYVARYDPNGRVVETAYLGINDEPAVNNVDGAFRCLFSYDRQGNLTETRVLGGNGRPANLNEGWTRQRHTYDSSNTLVDTTFWKANPQGRLVFWKRVDGINKDKEGNALVLELVNLTPEGIPQPVPQGYYWWAARYDARGNKIELAYFDQNRNPIAPEALHYHREVSRYDAKNNLIECVCYGVAGEPVFDNNGSFRDVYRVDEGGKRIETLRLGPNGRPRSGNDAWAKQRHTYDPSGTLVETSFWIANPKGGLVFWRREDGKQKNNEGKTLILELVNLTPDGIPQPWPEGHHWWARLCDLRGNEIEAAYFDQNRQPVAPKGLGYHRVLFRYDANNRLLEAAHFGVTGEPAFDNDGSFRLLILSDPEGKYKEILRLGPNCRPRNGKDGWAKWRGLPFLGASKSDPEACHQFVDLVQGVQDRVGHPVHVQDQPSP